LKAFKSFTAVSQEGLNTKDDVTIVVNWLDADDKPQRATIKPFTDPDDVPARGELHSPQQTRGRDRPWDGPEMACDGPEWARRKPRNDLR
jgi:hypothetical protein